MDNKTLTANCPCTLFQGRIIRRCFIILVVFHIELIFHNTSCKVAQLKYNLKLVSQSNPVLKEQRLCC